jgi:hypothetical protein
MIGKHPYIQFYTGDWLKDPALSVCSPAARGIWMDILCHLHERNNGGTLTASLEQISRCCRCSVSEAKISLDELRTNSAADISERGGLYSVTCRRMRKASELSAKRRQAGLQSRSNARARPDYDSDIEIQSCLEDYCQSIGLPRSDGTALYHKWEANGWTNSGKPIKDWKLTVLAWKDYGYLPSQKRRPGGADKSPEVADDTRRKINELRNRRREVKFSPNFEQNDSARAEYAALSKQIEQLEGTPI